MKKEDRLELICFLRKYFEELAVDDPEKAAARWREIVGWVDEYAGRSRLRVALGNAAASYAALGGELAAILGKLREAHFGEEEYEHFADLARAWATARYSHPNAAAGETEAWGELVAFVERVARPIPIAERAIDLGWSFYQRTGHWWRTARVKVDVLTAERDGWEFRARELARLVLREHNAICSEGDACPLLVQSRRILEVAP